MKEAVDDRRMPRRDVPPATSREDLDLVADHRRDLVLADHRQHRGAAAHRAVADAYEYRDAHESRPRTKSESAQFAAATLDVPKPRPSSDRIGPTYPPEAKMSIVSPI